jgi:hypothetical protein
LSDASLFWRTGSSWNGRYIRSWSKREQRMTSRWCFLLHCFHLLMEASCWLPILIVLSPSTVKMDCPSAEGPLSKAIPRGSLWASSRAVVGRTASQATAN